MSTRDKFWDLIEDNETCMMVTDAGSGIHARPMHAIPEDENNEIWFYTRLSSGKSEELAQDGEVCLTFACPKTNDYVSVTGDARLVKDQAKIKEYWNTFVDAWFPEGPEGGDVGMICVKVTKGEYWDGESSSVLAALKSIWASQTDQTPDMGEHRKVAV